MPSTNGASNLARNSPPGCFRSWRGKRMPREAMPRRPDLCAISTNCEARSNGVRGIKGILFDKDGTLVDFQATWFAIGDLMALKAADGDRDRANTLLEAA